jgi:hypothetical protein
MIRLSIPPIGDRLGAFGGGPGGVDRRAVAVAWRAPDDPAIDKGGAGRLDDRGDALGGLRAHRVAIDIDRFHRQRLQRRRQPRRQPLGLVGRQDRQSAPESSSRSSAAGCMPAAWARPALASLRPDSSVRMLAPRSWSRLPTPAPIVPCAMIATVMLMTSLLANWDLRDLPRNYREPAAMARHLGIALFATKIEISAIKCDIISHRLIKNHNRSMEPKVLVACLPGIAVVGSGRC